MLWVNLKRVVKTGFINFWRNGFVSLSSVLVMTVTLFVIGSTLFLLATLDSSLTDLKDKVDVNVYLATNVAEDDVTFLRKSLTALPEVLKVEYVSREEALAQFKKRHENDDLTLQALSELGDNPLGAVINITAKDPGQYEAIAEYLKSDSVIGRGSVISRVNYEDNRVAIEALTRIIASAKKLGLALSVALAIISIIICFNTIRLVIFISRDEISVMRLVGASNKYIRGPFVISGMMYGLFAGALTLGIFYPLTYWLGTATANFFSGVNIFHYYISNFGQFFGIIIGAGTALGAISSYLAVRRYLNIL